MAGIYAGTARTARPPYVRDFLGFIGITDVEFVCAEGPNMGDENRTPPLAGPQSTAALTANLGPPGARSLTRIIPSIPSPGRAGACRRSLGQSQGLRLDPS